MKTTADKNTSSTRKFNGTNPLHNIKDLTSFFNGTVLNDEGSEQRGARLIDSHIKDPRTRNETFSPGTAYRMATGQLPDLWGFCLELGKILNNRKDPFSAMQFVQLLQNQEELNKEQVSEFLKNPETRQVLLSNEYMEVVLIHWKPGKASDIHGHPEGGCLFKLLYGKLEELRYTPERKPKLLGFNSYRSGSLAYIDNQMAFHQVGNPYGSSAVSLHIYIK